jgi:hypothetical protein
MRKIFVLLPGLAVLPVFVFAQKNGSVKGVAFDTLSGQPVSSATISVVRKKDSSLVTFTLADNKGYFELRGIPSGEYRLLVTHVNYHNTNQFFTIDDQHRQVDLGNIVMHDASKMLSEVVVQNEAPPVTMINDTIQYNAGSFKTPPNASVEQLLKKLPGVKVEKDGTIQAQGERVNRVLVDGKEFFGNDPRIATKNLPADAVDKVQVYDRQSDQAQLTGFEDGNYEKTINLKLKADKKKGLFGKLNAGGGTDERYESRFNVNSFKGARQLSAIGLGNNNNAEGFSFMDILNFTGVLNQMRNSGGGGNINITVDASDPNAALPGMAGNNNNGISTVWGGGLNYNNIIGKKTDWQSNYFFNRYNPVTESNLQRQYPTGLLYNQNAFADNLSSSHRLNLNVLYQFDSSTTLRITPNFSYQQTRNRTQSDFKTAFPGQALINDGFGNAASSSDGFNFQNNLVFRKKLNKKGRTFSLSLQTTLNEADGDGSNYSVTGFYNYDGSLNRRDTLNQQYGTENRLWGYHARAVYTEPFLKRSLLEFSAGKSQSKNISEKTTMDYNGLNGKYDLPNQQLSNDYTNMYGYSSAGIRIRTQQKKYNYMLGASWQQAELEGTIVTGVKDSVIKKTFNNILPNARFQYYFSRFRFFAINYSTYTTQPTATQLQPVPDVSNPLNIRNGNPDLKQEFTHSIQGNLNMVKPYLGRTFFVFFNMQFTQNRIVNYDSLDQFGVRYSKPVNVNGVYTLNGTFSKGMPVRFLKGSATLSSRVNLYNGKQYINTGGAPVLTHVKTFTLGPDLRLDMTPVEKLSVALTARVNYNRSAYDKASALNTDYLQQEYEAELDWQLPAKFFFSTGINYILNSNRAAGFNDRVPLWNASVSRQFLKYNRGEIKLSVTDLLDRNTGISRSINQGYVEDRRVTTLRRFFMLGFTYSLSKTGLNNAGGGGMMRVNSR